MVVDLTPREEPDPIDIFDQNCLMIFDQNQSHLEYLSNVFQQQSYKVLTHTSGELGFKSAKRVLPDCILINSELLDMDGFDLCQKIVDESTTCGIPVILMGREASVANVKMAKAAGSEFFLSQPIDPRTLIFLVNESIAQARSWICE